MNWWNRKYFQLFPCLKLVLCHQSREAGFKFLFSIPKINVHTGNNADQLEWIQKFKVRQFIFINVEVFFSNPFVCILLRSFDPTMETNLCIVQRGNFSRSLWYPPHFEADENQRQVLLAYSQKLEIRIRQTSLFSEIEKKDFEHLVIISKWRFWRKFVSTAGFIMQRIKKEIMENKICSIQGTQWFYPSLFAKNVHLEAIQFVS